MSTTKGIFEQWKEEQRNIGRNKGRRDILEELSKKYSPEEISSMLNRKEREIKKK